MEYEGDHRRLSQNELRRYRKVSNNPQAPALARLRAIRLLFGHWSVIQVEAVRQARQEARSWEEIGDALGIARQSAHTRFRDAVDGEDDHA